jgi:hypothetical protein
MRRLVATLRTAATLWLVSGCGQPPPALHALHAVPQDTVAHGYLAAADKADITPPLHLSLFGHGPESRVATGVRLRLRCQPFVLAADGKIAALVPCDLQSSSSDLHVAVTKELRDLGVPIPGERLFIMATHTHAGPAHYFEARHYSGPFSSSIPGYDGDVTKFLARQIAASIVRAYQKLAPACIGWKATSLHELGLADMTFNRALVPFLSNRKDAASEEAPVDDGLFVLRIDPRQPGALKCDAAAPLGVFAVFGMHPTGIPNTNELYHGDIFGFATRTAEACLNHAVANKALSSLKNEGATCDESGPPEVGGVTVGLANGIEGDVSPKLDMQSVPNARRLGERLGTAIATVAVEIEGLRATGPFDATYWELWFPNARYDEDPAHRLCQQGDIGMSVAGGAHDGPTRLRVLPEANAGFQLLEPHGCQGVKLAARIQDSPSDYDFPRFGSIGLLRIGDARLATLPVEVTTTAGRRIRHALRQARADNADLALVGLTNQYLEYVTTEEEYPFQYYEGASDLYGPHTARFLERNLVCLDHWRHGEKHDCGGQFPIDHALAHWAKPDPVVSRLPQSEEVSELFLKRPLPFPSYTDGVRGWEIQFPRMPLDFTDDRGKFSVSVLAGATGETSVDDDDGSSIEVSEVDGSNHDRTRGCVDVGPGDCWRVRWTPELDGAASALCKREDKRFRIAIRGRYHFESEPFSIACATPVPAIPAGGEPKP